MVYSGFWKRLLALVIDRLILLIPGFLAGFVFRDFGLSLGSHVLLGFLYYPFFESSVLSATPGKALLGIQVLSETGDRLTFKMAATRYFSSYISAVICWLGYIIQVFTERRQALHDLLARTLVVDNPAPDLNFFMVWKDQFKEVVARL